MMVEVNSTMTASLWKEVVCVGERSMFLKKSALLYCDPIHSKSKRSGVLFENKYLFSANKIVDASILCLFPFVRRWVGDGWNAINTGLVTY